MQTKYLFGMLLSGAMLAACTAEDDFNSAKVAQEANPSAPVFTVKFDGQDLQNRATQNEGTSWRLGFDNGDLLSLYHGVSADENENYATFKGWQNAIYVGGQTASEGAMTFTTKSMVNPGGAILIWPADTTFQNNDNTKAPKLRITDEQDENTKNLIPYMSEVITIEDFVQVPERNEDYDQNVTAGYNRQYDITLKRVGSNLNLILNQNKTEKINAAIATAKTTGVKAADLEIKRVVLKNEKRGSNPTFTTAIPVKALADPSVAMKEIPNSGGKFTHPTWQNQSSVDDASTEIEQKDSLATTDIKDGKAVFTLLPSKKTDGKTPEMGLTEAQIWVYTNYGKVVLKDKNGTTKNEILKNRAGDTKYGVAEALNGILSDDILWAATTTETNPFYEPNNGEKMGAYATRQLDIDMSALDMNDLHIKDEDHLKSAIAVYEALKLDMEKHVNFILDGDENGKFIMHKATWEAVMAELATNGREDNKYHNLTFSPCVVGTEACTAIQLVNDGEAEEVPALQFELVDKLDPASGKVALALELVGNWKYTGVENGKSRDFAGLQTINVLKGATLALNDYIAVASYEENSNAAGVKSLEVKAGGFVTVDGNTYVQLPLNNLGTITVGTKGYLRAHEGGTVTNKPIDTAVNKNPEAGLDNGRLIANADGTFKSGGSGLIVNYGYIGSAPGTTGAVNNYGVIKNANSAAITLLTTNGMGENLTTTTGVAIQYNKSSNAIGSVYLYDSKSNQMNVSTGNVKGFVKLTVSKATPEAADFGTVANWITVAGDCHTIKYELDEKGKELYLPSKVDYIEIQPNADGSNMDVTIEGNLSRPSTEAPDARLYAIIVPENCRMFIPESSNVVMKEQNKVLSAIYAKGLIMYGKNSFSYDGRVAFESYFGGDAADKSNHMVETNG